MRPSRLLWISLLVLTTGCASYFKRKECENTNWRQHGHNVAMSGKRLDADDFVRQCQKVEAKIGYQDADLGFKEGMGRYCTLDQIFLTGKSGKAVNYNLCDGQPLKAMQKRYADGINEYCQETNGYPVGASGAVYENVCPKTLESVFLKEYRRGRKVHLAAMINEKERQVSELEREISRLELERNRKSFELTQLNNRVVVQHQRTYDPVTRTYVEQSSTQLDDRTQRQRNDLEWDVRNLSNNIDSNQAEKRKVNELLRQLRLEMVGL
ncbi:MAG: DUF2799 domain-containing protein [Bdellovibrionales bacterium]